MPHKWQYYHDIGFVYYWRLRDYQTAALVVSAGRGAAERAELAPAAGRLDARARQDRAAARFLWQQIAKSEEAWLRRNAERSLLQLQALDQIDQLESRGATVSASRLASATRGPLLIAQTDPDPRMPVDPAGTPYDIDPATGRVQVSETVAAVSDAGGAPAAPVNLEPFQLAILVAARAGGWKLSERLHPSASRASSRSILPPSRCPACEYRLSWFDNIPVVSYAVLGGRCRKCRARISIRYPLVELVDDGAVHHAW